MGLVGPLAVMRPDIPDDHSPSAVPVREALKRKPLAVRVETVLSLVVPGTQVLLGRARDQSRRSCPPMLTDGLPQVPHASLHACLATGAGLHGSMITRGHRAAHELIPSVTGSCGCS